MACSEWLLPESALPASVAAGIVVGRRPGPHTAELDGLIQELAQLAITMLFPLLAADVSWAELSPLGWGGILCVLSLMLVVRPIGVRFGHHWVCPTSLSNGCSWVGSLREASSPRRWPLCLRFRLGAGWHPGGRTPSGVGVPHHPDDRWPSGPHGPSPWLKALGLIDQTPEASDEALLPAEPSEAAAQARQVLTESGQASDQVVSRSGP